VSNKNIMETFKVGSKVKISPDITGEKSWIVGIVREVKDNPFNGIVVYAQAVRSKIIYFNKQKYFKQL
jgi:hypothetical protein